jgi:hypothetical protein
MKSAFVAAIAASAAAAVTVCTAYQFAYLHILRPNRRRRRYQPPSPCERFEFKVENWLNSLVEKGYGEQCYYYYETN